MVASLNPETRNRRRLQNMILAIGPGTPGSFIIKGDELSVGTDDDDDDDDDSGVGASMYIGDSANEEEMHETEDDVDLEEEVEDEDGDDIDEFTNEGEEEERGGGHNSSSDRDDYTMEDVRHDRSQRRIEDESDDDDEESNEQANSSNRNRVCGINDSYNTRMMSSMIHGGCINTASWLDGGWRISTVHQEDKHPHLHVHGDDDDEGICRNVNFSASSIPFVIHLFLVGN